MKPIFEEELIVNISTRIIVNEKPLASAKI